MCLYYMNIVFLTLLSITYIGFLALQFQINKKHKEQCKEQRDRFEEDYNDILNNMRKGIK